MPDFICEIFGGKPKDSEKAEIRAAQIKESAQFIADTHVEGNVAIIAGDFNVQKNRARWVLWGAAQFLTRYFMDPKNDMHFNDWYLLGAFCDEHGRLFQKPRPGRYRPSFGKYLPLGL